MGINETQNNEHDTNNGSGDHVHCGGPPAFAQQDTPGKPTAKGQTKESGKEVGKAGKSLGHNVKHGRVLRGGKRFGKHIGYAGRHIGRGTMHAVKTAVKP